MYAQQTRQDSAFLASHADHAAVDLLSGAPVCEAQASGNQAAVEDAGLGSDAGLDLAGLGDMADMVLETLGLSLALPLAAQWLHLPAVRGWVEDQDPAQVAQAMSWTMRDTLREQWPVGLGVRLQGRTAAALGLGADLDGSVELVRLGGDTVRTRVHLGAAFGLDEVGAKAGVTSASGEAVARLAATTELKLATEFDGALEGDFTVAMLAAVAALAAPGQTLALLSAQPVLDLVAGAAGLDLQAFFGLDELSWERTHGVRAEGELTALQALPDALAFDPTESIGVLGTILDGLDGLGQLELASHLDVVSAPGALELRVGSTLSGLVELAGLPLLATALDAAALAELAELVGAGGQVELRCGLAVSQETGVTMSGSGASISLSLDRRRGGETLSDTLDLHLDQLPAVIAGLRSGLGLSSLLAATGFSRQVQVPAPADLAAAVLPGAARGLEQLLGDRGLGLSGAEDLHLVGSLSAPPQALALLADSALQAPDGMAAPEALAALHDALCAAATGQGAVAPWLQPWLGELQQVARAMVLDQPRLQGQLLVGLGGGAKVTGGASVGAEGSVQGGLVVDLALDGVTSIPVLQALATGSTGVQSCEGPDPLLQAAPASTQHASTQHASTQQASTQQASTDTGTETSAAGAARPAGADRRGGGVA